MKQNIMYTPKVSVIMPAYNAERTLPEAINSVLNQTFSDLELIVCNDASTDGTSSILVNITDKRLRVIKNSVNLGPGLSRDKAIDISRGERIAFIDADDIWMPERLEVLLNAAGISQDVMLFDDILECHDTPSGMIPWRLLRGKKAFGGNGEDPVDVPADKFICSKRLVIQPLIPSCFVNKYNIKHSNLSFAEDTEFFLELMSKGIILRFVPYPMYYYRITPGSATAQTKRTTMMLQVLKKALVKFNNYPDIYSALLEKINLVSREEQYMLFIQSFKNKDLKKTFSTAIKSPWIIPEFVQRSCHDIAYHIHRVRHSGQTRGLR
jgi:succinoglycan biosynthesis protein ExoO